MFGTATYSPEEVLITLNGYRIKDFAPDVFIEVIRNTPSFIDVRGIRGKGTRKGSRDKSGKIILRIMQTSPVNAVLSEIVQKDEVNYSGLLTISITDRGGSTGLLFMDCYLEAPTNMSFSGDATIAREWVFNFEYTSRYDVGGNRKSPLDLSNLPNPF